MNKIKVWAFVALIALLFSCSNTGKQENIITVTILPQKYFVEQLVDSFFHVDCMVDPGLSPESYDPSPGQMARLSKSKAYFCIGHIGFEEAWIGNLKKNNPKVLFFNNSEGVDYIYSEHQHGNHVHTGIDPHTWTSPKQVSVIVGNMFEALKELDPEHSQEYAINYLKLKEEIDETDRIVESLLDSLVNRSFIIYHPTLTYFARDYGLTQYAIEIEGKEPSPVLVRQLIDLAKENNVKTVFIQEEFDKKNAEQIAKETGCRLVVINPLSYNWSEEIIKIAQELSYE